MGWKILYVTVNLASFCVDVLPLSKRFYSYQMGNFTSQNLVGGWKMGGERNRILIHMCGFIFSSFFFKFGEIVKVVTDHWSK